MAHGPNRMEMTLERKDAARWKAVEPGLVFEQGDRLRFRFRTNFDGYLYVMNQGTSGSYDLLFPREDTGRQNKIEAGKEYVVPATEGYFKVTGPAGHDIVYWVISPVEMRSPLPEVPKAASPRHSMSPRCDDAVFRVRGQCVDNSAGPKGVDEPNQLPESLSSIGGAKSRELIFIRERDKSVVSSPVPLQGPVVYEFRLAHR